MTESEAQLKQKLIEHLTGLGHEPLQRTIQKGLTPKNVCLDC